MSNSPYNHLAVTTDLYELTMMQGYFLSGIEHQVVFDMFFRKPPFDGGYGVFAGLDPLLSYLENLSFTYWDLDYLNSLGIFVPEFLRYLEGFSFEGDLCALEEGTVVFANEPILRVQADIKQAQLIETLLLNTINFQTLIATKASRVVEAAAGKPILEFGLRRAQGLDGALSASRASFIGGVSATSHVHAAQRYGIPAKGTMAHSWIMAFDSEEEAFARYAELYPDNAILLVDTYDTLNQGIPAAIGVLKRLQEKGHQNYGIRLDSGDLDYMSRKARRMLDQAGLPEAKILASNDLNEFIISELEKKKVPIDAYGVGTHLVTAQNDPSLSGVYKLVGRKNGDGYQPSIKISNSIEKMSNPGVKNVLRLYHNGMMLADLVYLQEEEDELVRKVERTEPITFYHPTQPDKLVFREYADYRILLQRRMEQGRRLQQSSSLQELQKKHFSHINSLENGYRRFFNPHKYKVSLTRRLKELKMDLWRRSEEHNDSAED
jgi:nicotinate phosphoribosyltransferase